MSVRAKFKVSSITDTGDFKTISLQPVVSGSEENKAFFKWTPGGNINLNCCNPAVVEQMTPGKEFYVDFTEAIKPEVKEELK